MTRYYDLRLVTIDLLANLYKEQQAALVPDLLALANERFGETAVMLPPSPCQKSKPTIEKTPSYGACI
ncbi:MAG: hypothetical protein M5U34_43240 [Chloroflexi bacterium]|nr:hypothetical protein [Chloroflexota bacterium]